MATLLETLKTELYDFFNAEIAPIIKKEIHNPVLIEAIHNKFAGKFSTKYSFMVKSYGDTIRISATYKPLGIVFFMAQTKSGGKKAKFLDPCYWGEGK
jgi:hypothetical protein